MIILTLFNFILELFQMSNNLHYVFNPPFLSLLTEMASLWWVRF